MKHEKGNEMSKHVASGKHTISSQPLYVTYPDGTEKLHSMQLVCSKGGHRYARIYWHAEANEPVVATEDGACMKMETTHMVLCFMPFFDTMLMICEAQLQNPSADLINNCNEMKRNA